MGSEAYAGCDVAFSQKALFCVKARKARTICFEIKAVVSILDHEVSLPSHIISFPFLICPQSTVFDSQILPLLGTVLLGNIF